MKSVALGTAAVCTALLCAPAAGYRVDWRALDDAFSAYLQQPGQGTARQVTGLLPPGSADRHAEAFNIEVARRIHGQLGRLDIRARRGQADAIDVAFALIAISDGHFTEELLAMIAGSLDADPAAFLAALKRNESRLLAGCDLAIDTGLDHLDDPKAELAHLERRLAEVERVSVPELQAEKQCVLESLRHAVRTMKENVR